MYCCSVWCSAVNKAAVKSKLRSTQRTFTTAITRSFGSASTEALLVISSLIPIDLRIKEAAALRFYALSETSAFSPRTFTSIHNLVSSRIDDVEHPVRFFSSDHPPWKDGIRKPILLPIDGPVSLLPSTLNSLRVFTDGSVIGGRTGYGVVICSADKILATCRGRLPDGCTIFQAEGAAVRAALRYLPTLLSNIDAVDILVDSQSALSSCVTTDKITPLFSEIRSLILDLPVTVQLFWVAAHKGHEGNEIADQLAKSGALSLDEPTDRLPLPMATIRAELREATSTLWEQEWQDCVKGRKTKDFFPSIRLPRPMQSISLSGKLTQVLTGHCYLRGHLFRLKLIDSPLCMCGIDDETVPHILFYCPLLEPFRADLRATVSRRHNVWPPNVKALCESQSAFAALGKFVERCGRFDAPLSQISLPI